jgi:hypothetical protein
VRDIREDSHDKHFQVVYGHLIGKQVDPMELWMGVGYFVHGTGRHANLKPWTSQVELDKLLQDTGRN